VADHFNEPIQFLKFFRLYQYVTEVNKYRNRNNKK